MLVEFWEKGLRYNESSINSSIVIVMMMATEKKGVIVVQPVSIQWKTSVEGGMWMQELNMLNSKHAEFKATSEFIQWSDWGEI